MMDLEEKDYLEGIENIIGTNYTDNITGDSNKNYIFGGLGNDTLSGGAGNDTLEGGVGDDFALKASAFDDGSDTFDGEKRWYFRYRNRYCRL